MSVTWFTAPCQAPGCTRKARWRAGQKPRKTCGKRCGARLAALNRGAISRGGKRCEQYRPSPLELERVEELLARLDAERRRPGARRLTLSAEDCWSRVGGGVGLVR